MLLHENTEDVRASISTCEPEGASRVVKKTRFLSQHLYRQLSPGLTVTSTTLPLLPAHQPRCSRSHHLEASSRESDSMIRLMLFSAL